MGLSGWLVVPRHQDECEALPLGARLGPLPAVQATHRDGLVVPSEVLTGGGGR